MSIVLTAVAILFSPLTPTNVECLRINSFFNARYKLVDMPFYCSLLLSKPFYSSTCEMKKFIFINHTLVTWLSECFILEQAIFARLGRVFYMNSNIKYLLFQYLPLA